MRDCVFCNLSDKEIVDRCDLTLTIRDSYPVSNGHTLVIPKRHVQSIFEVTAEEIAALIQALKIARDALGDEHSPDGFNIGVNDGESAGQTVPHLHIHLIPRYKDDVIDPRGGIRWVFPEKAAYWEAK